MTKLGPMLIKHQAAINGWKGTIGPKIEEKVKINIVKGEVYTISPFMENLFGVFVGNAVINVDIAARKCTCHGWEMSGIPCELACAVAIYLRKNIADLVDDVFKYPTQEKVYSCMFVLFRMLLAMFTSL